MAFRSLLNIPTLTQWQSFLGSKSNIESRLISDKMVFFRSLAIVVLVSLVLAKCTDSFSVGISQNVRHLSCTRLTASKISTSFMWNAGLNYGKGNFKFYSDFDEWMSVFPEEDKAQYPEIFTLPKGLYEVKLTKPLGIIFEEIDFGRGLYVQDLVEGGNADASGKVQVGDRLVGITAVKVVGAKYERRMIPCRGFAFDTMVGAIESNSPRYACEDVVLFLERPDEADSVRVDEFLEFFEPPFDNPWKQA